VLGLMIGLANIGTAIGPILGGGLAGTAGWRWVFFVNVPICVVAFLWGARTLPDARDPEGHTVRQLDWLGAGLVVLAVATLSLGIDGLSAAGLLALSTCGALDIGIAALVLFVVQEHRHRWPLVSPALMRRRPFWTLLGAGTFANMMMAVLIIIAIIQLQQVRGLSSAAAGMLFIFPALASALCGPLSGRIAGRAPEGLVMALSIVVGGVGMIVQSVAGSLAVDVIGLTICGLAFGMGYALTNVVTQSVLPEELSGQASGVVLTTLVTLGGVAVVIGAAGLELFAARRGLASGTDAMQLWTGVVAILVGLLFGWSQRRTLHARAGASA
jgi:MFS family permease